MRLVLLTIYISVCVFWMMRSNATHAWSSIDLLNIENVHYLDKQKNDRKWINLVTKMFEPTGSPRHSRSFWSWWFEKAFELAFNIDLKESSNLITVIQTSNINVRGGLRISLVRTLGIRGVAFKNQKRASEIQLYLVVMSSSLGKICSQLERNPWNPCYALHSNFPCIPKRLHECSSGCIVQICFSSFVGSVLQQILLYFKKKLFTFSLKF